jgi:D-amino-acid dehydrogenase
MLAARGDRVRRGTELIRGFSFASLELHKELVRQGLDTGLEVLGAINVYETEKAYVGGIAEAEDLSSHGIKAQVMNADEARTFEPALSDAIVGGVFYPEEAQCDPERFMLAVADAAVEAGAELCTRAEVLDATVSGGRVVRLDTTIGEIRPGQVVVANGAWTAELSRRLGLPIPVQGGKGYHVDLMPSEGDPAVPIYLQEARVIATPYANRLRLAGTLQLTGLSMRMDQVRVRATLRSGMRTLRGIETSRVTELWRGMPVHARRPADPRAVRAAGQRRLRDRSRDEGFHLAPETGRVIAQVALDEPPTRDLTPFSPDRFRWGARGKQPPEDRRDR